MPGVSRLWYSSQPMFFIELCTTFFTVGSTAIVNAKNHCLEFSCSPEELLELILSFPCNELLTVVSFVVGISSG